MKVIGGILMVLGGIALGLYVGVWICLVGGIVDIVNQFKAVDTSAMAILIGLLKIGVAGILGWGSAFALMFPGFYFIFGTKTPRRTW